MFLFYYIILWWAQGRQTASSRKIHNQATSAQLVSSRQAQISPTLGPAETAFSQACAEESGAPRTSWCRLVYDISDCSNQGLGFSHSDSARPVGFGQGDSARPFGLGQSHPAAMVVGFDQGNSAKPVGLGQGNSVKVVQQLS